MLRKAFRAVAVSWALTLWLVPLTVSRPSAATFGVGYPFALLMYGVGSLVCHQRPERSFILFGARLPVCARCTGIYVGAAIASIALWRMKTPSRTALLLSALPMFATLVFEWTTGEAPGNMVRAATGVPLGATVAWIVCRKVN